MKVYRYSVPCGPIKVLYYKIIDYISAYAYEKVSKIEGEFDFIHAHFFDMGYAASKIFKKIKYHMF